MTGKAFIVFGLGFGDEGKGTMVDWLAREYGASTVIRYTSGPQCGHNVVLSDGRHHEFHCFGSASFIPGVKTHIARTAMLDPIELMAESQVFEMKTHRNLFDSLSVDPMCPVLTPYHASLNRLRELNRGTDRHGSCGYGVGELRNWIEQGRPVLRAFELMQPNRLMVKLTAIGELAHAETVWSDPHGPFENCEEIHKEFLRIGRMMKLKADEEVKQELDKQVTIFEGGQGILLDEHYGWWPHNTWADTTPRLAQDFIAGAVPTETIGVIRTYHTRHGAGPFPTEDRNMLPDPGEHNRYNEWQQAFRIGHFDLMAFKYAVACSGMSSTVAVALTHCDRQWNEWRFAERYQDGAKIVKTLIPGLRASTIQNCKALYGWYADKPKDIVDTFEGVTGRSVGYVSFGPTESDKVHRKDWRP